MTTPFAERARAEADGYFGVKSEGIGPLGQPSYSADAEYKLRNNYAQREAFLTAFAYGYRYAVQVLRLEFRTTDKTAAHYFADHLEEKINDQRK